MTRVSSIELTLPLPTVGGSVTLSSPSNAFALHAAVPLSLTLALSPSLRVLILCVRASVRVTVHVRVCVPQASSKLQIKEIKAERRIIDCLKLITIKLIKLN